MNESIRANNSVAFIQNMDVDEELGSLVSRLGTGIVESQLQDGKVCLGLHNFRDSVGSGHKLFAVFNVANDATATIHDVASTDDRTSQTASTKTRFVTFLDSMLAINGADAELAWNGSSWISTGGAFDLANIPSSNKVKYAIEWQDRVYVAGDTAAATSDRIYYSSTPSAGVVSFTTGNGQQDIEPEDGGGTITGFGKVPGYLLIFKERSVKRWNFLSAFPETLMNIGTPSQESVINAGGLCAFFSASSRESKGFYVTNGGRPVPISHDVANGIKKWVDAIPQAYEDDVAGWGNERYLMWSIGDVTVDGTDYTNVVLKYHLKLKAWTMRTYPSEFRFFSGFVSSGNNVLVGGDDDGTILEIDKVSTYTDYNSGTAAAVPIHWKVRSHDEDFKYYNLKTISERVIVNSRKAHDARLEIGIDGEWDGDKAMNVGKVWKDYSELKLKRAITGHRFSWALAGSQNGGRAYIKGVEFPHVEVLPNYS